MAGGDPHSRADESAMEPPRPLNWNLLTSTNARFEWNELDGWVKWLRDTYGLGPTTLPPFWHRHWDLVWELSALHLHWLCAYDPQQHGSAPLGWHRDFHDASVRLRNWTADCGTKLDRDRPTRVAAWPGAPLRELATEVVIADRDADFAAFVDADVAGRRAREDALIAAIAAA
nr:hypothetical protein [Demequina sediminis]